MEVHSPAKSVIAKRLWNILRITFFMIRKGLISKRKMMMDMSLMMKKGKVMRKTLGNLMFHHHSKHATRGEFGKNDYEFSCSNSPNPIFFHPTSKRRHHYFSCIKPHEPEEPKYIVSQEYSYNFQFSTDLAPEEKLTSPLKSPFSVRVSNYSEVDENDGNNREVDNDAEEFIRRFYEQLRVQSRMQLLEYQEMQYQEMLARGSG
ncbi:hypothetical protein GIB67_038327 [Kingdonia uniflora]|uniref:DUF761 domain-containing protein n=1 Tax=Kingdonia uniflora TaxID=39325 RepID=A0A7J7KUK6_9MAGN|nr:hypothetical protein GIB67_038327 [Kingdonia uniflora]